MYLYLVYRNNIFQMQCHADDELNAIDIAMNRMGFPTIDRILNTWDAEQE